MPYHVILAGSATLENPADGTPVRLRAGDILLFSQGSGHVLNDGSGARAKPARQRENSTITISENAGSGERLDMLCGRFALTATHERLLRNYLPSRLVLRADAQASAGRTDKAFPGVWARSVAACCTRSPTR